jgi:hypothetical protein
MKDVPNLRVAIIAHGDYCDEGETYVVKSLDFTTDVSAICKFIMTVDKTGGGDSPECYEKVLHDVRSLKWKAGNKKALVLIGDDVPHEPTYHQNVQRINWRNELKLLLEAGIHVYGVHALAAYRQHAKHFYEEIARVTNGFYLTLDQFSAMTDIIFAVCYQQIGIDQVRAYREEVRCAGRMNRNMRSVFQTLTDEAGIDDFTGSVSGLVPVPPGRFQVMLVDTDQAIRDFVEEQGLTFNKGRGFYEFTKTETVQEKKEVVLMDRHTGDMFTGSEARVLIGLPYGMRGRIKPTILDQYKVFVQSTSYNRRLVGGTSFLYEVEDWDR